MASKTEAYLSPVYHLGTDWVTTEYILKQTGKSTEPANQGGKETLALPYRVMNINTYAHILVLISGSALFYLFHYRHQSE